MLIISKYYTFAFFFLSYISPMYQYFRCIAIIISILAGTRTSSAQNKNILTDENQLKALLKQSSFNIDTTAQAIVLYEKGEALLDNNNLTFIVERIIKITGQEGVNQLATIDVPMSRWTIIRKVKGETYNLENDEIVKQSIEKSDILNDKTTEYATVSKFNLPAVKPGSVIHYTYIEERPFTIFIPSWNFQQNFPTLYSEYAIKVPSYINFTPLANAAIPFKQVKFEKELAKCDACYFNEEYNHQRPTIATWVRRNVKAFKKEPFMSSEENFIERVKIQLMSLSMGERSGNSSLFNNWTNVTETTYYKNDNSCGQVFRPNIFLNDGVKQLTAGKKDNLAKAKSIYAFVRDSIKLKQESYNDFDALFDIRDVYKRREGNHTGINLLLTAMLRNAELESQPVIMTTRSAEHLDPIMPNPMDVNYQVALVKIDEKDYFLDASDKFMPFGVLPAYCYNGYCRIIDKVPAAAELHPDGLKNKNITMVSLLPEQQFKDKLLLKVDQKFGDVSAAQLRHEYKGDSVKLKEKILKGLSKMSLPANLTRYSFNNLQNPDQPLTIHYEALLNWESDKDIIYMDPYFDKLYEQNPFPATNRLYPIEMDHLNDIKYIFRFQLPSGYIVEDFPKSKIINYGNDGLIQLKNVLVYDAENNLFNLECSYNEKTTVFPAEGYAQLRSFHDNIIEEQRQKIVLKKTK